MWMNDDKKTAHIVGEIVAVKTAEDSWYYTYCMV